jgi:hypothetical protein
LKVLSEREVAPQLGLLKSTLLQLDSTFSEREYGAGSFRDFMEKVAQTGAVTLKNAGRSMMVESREDGDVEEAAPVEAAAPARSGPIIGEPADEEEEVMPASPMTMQDGIRAVQQAFAHASPPPRWPMYVRQAKQFLKTRIEGFDERRYGFASVVDLLRAAAKEGVLKLERDRHGAFRVFAGVKLTTPAMSVDVEETPVEVAGEVVAEEPLSTQAEPIEEAPIVDVQPVEEPEPVALDVEPEPATPKKGARKRKPAARGPAGSAPRPKAAKAPPARKTSRTKSEAADR